MKLLTRLLLAVFLVFVSLPAYCISGPILIMDTEPAESEAFVYGIGPVIKYKHVKGLDDFEGDMGVFGARAYLGRINDPQFGIMSGMGSVKGEAYKLEIKMTGATIEDSFREDPRVRWRVTCGIGNYDYTSRASSRSLKSSSFGFLEPQIVGVLPLSRHIVLEFALGYTFTNTKGVRLEGVAFNSELLLGRF